jgi:hypothetical protein
MDTPSEQGDSRLGTLIAFLIAVVSVVGAVVAWRASVAADGAGDADTAGIRATLNVIETDTLNTINAYSNYGSYTEYQQYRWLGDALAEDLQDADDEELAIWGVELLTAIDRAESMQGSFESRYVDPDGTYALQRQLDEAQADAARERDLNPNPHFAEADALRVKTSDLLIALMILSLSLIFFTLVETVGARGKLALVALGMLCMVAGTVFAVMIEMRGL